jgi:hypothetical protein
MAVTCAVSDKWSAKILNGRGLAVMPCHADEDALVAGLTGQPGTWPTAAACLPPMAATRFGPPICC